MCQAGSGYASDRGMRLGAWHLQLEQQQQQRVAALGCVCASSLERSRRCQKVAPQLSLTSLADASRSAKREGKVVSNVSNPRSCLNPPSPPLGSVTISPASFFGAIAECWLLWSYVIVVVVVVVMGNCYSFNMTRQSVLPSPPPLFLYTFAAVRLSIVLRANSSQPAPPILLPLSLPFPFTLSDSLKFV